jgi:hypothetical protein
MFDISLEELKSNLEGSTPVHFAYMKTDGTRRSAVGTLNPNLIPESLKPKETESKKVKTNNLKYYDLEKEAWRSLRLDASIVWIIE